MNDLTQYLYIDKSRLSREDYFPSLLSEGLAAGLLSPQLLDDIQQECIALLAQISRRATSGDSSSVRLEFAQSLLESMLFTMSVYLKTRPPDDAVGFLIHSGAREAYARGRSLITAKVHAAKHLHAQVQKTMLSTENETYNATLVDGIAGFFKLYDEEYMAQEIHITADYPLSREITGLAGIEFILAYLKAALLENRFMASFEANSIHRMMKAYHTDYPLLVINIFDQTLASALGCILAGVPADGLLIPRERVLRLQSGWLLKPPEELYKLISQAYTHLEKQLALTKSVSAYARQSLENLCGNIHSALQTLTLDKVFVG